ncbi:hypothetical protein, partial [Escherichia coli]|uniref:hypothetical protein n=1 Tax=Escherichia coli TaxID=562 RepID=UPI003EE4C964
MKAVTFYLIMVCDFKFILWINCEAELIREEKQKKRRRVRRLGWICRERAILGDFVICLNVLLQSVAKLHFKR